MIGKGKFQSCREMRMPSSFAHEEDMQLCSTVKMHVARFPSLFIQGARYVPKFREEIGLGDIWNLAGKVIKRQDKNLNGSFSEQKSATSDRSAIRSDA